MYIRGKFFVVRSISPGEALQEATGGQVSAAFLENMRLMTPYSAVVP